jgi:NitT/TauT family transport system permease protein
VSSSQAIGIAHRTAAPGRNRARAIGRVALAVLLRTVPIAVIIGLWQFASDSFDVPVLFPSPLAAAQKFLDLIDEGRLQTDILASMSRILTGFALGVALGAVLGLVAGTSRRMAMLMAPHVTAMRFIGSTSLISIMLIWFGIGELSKVLLIVYTTTFVVLLNTTIGVMTMHPAKLRAARVFGCSPAQAFWHVTLPSVLPHILGGARLAMMNSFMTVVAAEMIAADSGLGFLIFSSRQWMETDAIFVGMFTLGVLGLLTDRALVLATRVLFARYQPPG